MLRAPCRLPTAPGCFSADVLPPVPAARAAESHITSSEDHFLPPTDLAFRLLRSQ